MWYLALPVREPSPRTVESVLELIYLWFPELVCVRQSANPVRELNKVSELDTSVEFGNRLNVHDFVYVLERLITKDDLALNIHY